MSEISGQTVLTDFIEPAQPEAEDVSAYYDEEGNLLPEPREADGGFGVPAEHAERLKALAVEINMLEAGAKDTFKRTALEIGRRLIEAQNMVPKGRWGEWLTANIAYSTRKANQLMEVYTAYGDKALPEAYNRLSFTQIYDLLAASPEDRDQLAEQAAEEGLSTRSLKERIRALEEDRQKDNQKIYDLIQESEAKDRTIRQQQERVDAAQAEAKAAAETADEMRKVSSRAVDEASVSAQRASDAVNRANQTAKDLADARARIAALESGEELPEAVRAEMEDLRRQLESAQAGKDDERSKTMLALNLQVRLAIIDINDKAVKAKRAIRSLEGLDAEQAGARRKELAAAAALITNEEV